jgi:hypothetical protein
MPIVQPNKVQIEFEAKLEAIDRAFADLDSKLDTLSNKVDNFNKKNTEGAQAAAGATERQTLTWTELNQAIEVGMRVVDAFAEAYNAVIDATVEYANNVRRVKEITGQTAEESSRLLQVLDDYKVSADDLNIATKKLTSEGLSPNIKTLAELSDQFLALAPGVERADFLYDKFGKSGTKFAEIMGLGSDAIYERNDAIAANLVMTEKDLQQSRLYEENLDAINDSLMAVKIQAGNFILPRLNTAIENQQAYNDALQETIRIYGDHGDRANNYRTLLLLEQQANFEAADALNAHADALNGDALKITDVNKALDEEVVNYEELLNSIMRLTDLDKDYAESQEGVKAKQEEIKVKIQELLDQGWWPLSDKVKDLQNDYDDLGVKYEENAQKHKDATDKILLDMALEKIAMLDGVKGFSDAEYEKALAVATTMGAAEEASIREQKAFDDVTTAIANGTLEAGNIKRAIDMLEDKTITITTVIATINAENSPSHGAASMGGSHVKRDSGGRGFPGEAYFIGIGAQPEAFIPDSPGTFVPNADRMMGGINLTFVYSPGVSLGDERELRDRIAPAMLDLIRQAQDNGVISS